MNADLGHRIENSGNLLNWEELTTTTQQYISEIPPHREFIFRDTLPRKIVGMLNAAGGTGKTFLAIQMAITMAAGLDFGPFRSMKQFSVLYIGGEDSNEELWRRLYYCMDGMQITRQAIEQYLAVVSLMGKSKPLIEADKKGNPQITAQYYWLYQSIREFPRPIDMVIIDPLSRFYGLDENNNVHATAWIVAMEKIAYDLETAVIFTHHTGKAKTSLQDTAGRGASAFYDGCRWVGAARKMEPKTAERYKVSHRDYIEFDVIKNSYSRHLPASQYFRRSENGVLLHTELWKDRIMDLTGEYEKLVQNGAGRAEVEAGLKKYNSTFERSELRHVIRMSENRSGGNHY